jgi:hypothetical protein
MKAFHDMSNEFLRTSFVHFLLATVIVEYAIEAEPDVLDLLALEREVGLLECRYRVRVGRVENEDAIIENFENLAVLRGYSESLSL